LEGHISARTMGPRSQSTRTLFVFAAFWRHSPVNVRIPPGNVEAHSRIPGTHPRICGAHPRNHGAHHRNREAHPRICVAPPPECVRPSRKVKGQRVQGQWLSVRPWSSLYLFLTKQKNKLLYFRRGVAYPRPAGKSLILFFTSIGRMSAPISAFLEEAVKLSLSLSLSLSMHDPMLSLSPSMHELLLSLSMLVLDPNNPD